MSEIEIKNVSKKYETKDGTVEALKNVSLSIEQGDIYGIIGMSGAGKSTLVRCMNFLEEPTEGQVLIKGRTLGSLSKKELRKQREDIGMIFQHFNLLMQKSVIDNVCFPLYIQGNKKKEARAKALEFLEIVGLQDRAKAYPAQLSGGQKQRLAMARALLKDSGVYIFDQYNNCYSSYKRTPRKVNKYIQGADWYKKMQSAGGNGFFYKGSDGTIEYYENNNYLCYVRQILDKKDYKPLATLLITFDNTVLQGYFNQVSEDSKNQFYIIDSKGNYVIKPQEGKRDFKKGRRQALWRLCF